ncbi:transglutaminase TgpA family protein [Virgibacillus sp. DJP39]|uniref:transglutaminase TgpA family protein n=1 Tax=Virgibacillus sp. DJP39 TaxID=3409790 RepID=UPI003BB66ECA
MNLNTETKTPFMYNMILYTAGFILFLEWLYPVKDLTDTSSLIVFILYTAFCFFITLTQINWWLSYILKGAGLLYILNGLYFQEAFFSRPWLYHLFSEVSLNIAALVSQEWYNLTPMFRSLLFLLLIWLMSYLIYYWFVAMNRIFLFVLLTFVYIAVLDTFTVFIADAAIVRIFVISFIALGVASLSREMNRESIRFLWMKKTSIWMFPLIGVVLLSTVVGYAAPKLEPQWPDPVPFLKSTAEGAGSQDGGTGIRKVGYGEDDTHLGGSFIQDETPVFTVRTEEEQYWRIETKDVYTGKGWINSHEPEYINQDPQSISLNTFDESVETEEMSAQLELTGNVQIPKVIYPYGIDKMRYKEKTELLLDKYSEELVTKFNGNELNLDSYNLTFQSPIFEINSLRNATAEDSEDIIAQYTQLPGNLPDRVGELAREVTAKEENRYDKARAIETYFGQNGFKYNTNNVSVPGENQDYVDQFLFDTKIGYCDNYSTSMVVMLRTLDIPARWVKGFTSGEQLIEDNAEFDIFEVRNSNAHSWVEVYFPGKGWVPFEPTQGFSNLTDFQIDVDNDIDEEDTAVPAMQEQPSEPEEETEEAVESAGSKNGELKLNWWYIGGATGILLLLGWFIYVKRYVIQSFLLGLRLKASKNQKTYQDAYHFLLKQLAHKGHPKEASQTLREYAKRIDRRYNSRTMRLLTISYERILYTKTGDSEEIAKLAQLWKGLIKQIRS